MGKSKNKEETTEFGTAPEGEAEAQESAVEAEEE
jgi:hypothetical protein